MFHNRVQRKISICLYIFILTIIKCFGDNYTSIQIDYVSDIQETLKGGDTLFLKGGIYYLNKTLILWNCAGKEGNPIVITAVKGEKVIIDGSLLNGDWTHGISICCNSKFLSIENFEIRNIKGGHGISVWLESVDGIDREGISIKNNIIHDCDHHGIAIATNDSFASEFFKIRNHYCPIKVQNQFYFTKHI